MKNYIFKYLFHKKTSVKGDLTLPSAQSWQSPLDYLFLSDMNNVISVENHTFGGWLTKQLKQWRKVEDAELWIVYATESRWLLRG